MNEKELEAAIEGLKLIETCVTKTNEINKRLTFVMMACVIAFAIAVISFAIRDSIIAKSYFGQSYMQEIESSTTSMSQKIGGDVN